MAADLNRRHLSFSKRPFFKQARGARARLGRFRLAGCLAGGSCFSRQNKSPIRFTAAEGPPDPEGALGAMYVEKFPQTNQLASPQINTQFVYPAACLAELRRGREVGLFGGRSFIYIGSSSPHCRRLLSSGSGQVGIAIELVFTFGPQTRA